MTCKNCGKEIDDTAIFCDYCGAKVEKEEITTERIIESHISFENKRKKDIKMFLIFFGVAMAAFIVILFLTANLAKFGKVNQYLADDEYLADMMPGFLVENSKFYHGYEFKCTMEQYKQNWSGLCDKDGELLDYNLNFEFIGSNNYVSLYSHTFYSDGYTNAMAAVTLTVNNSSGLIDDIAYSIDMSKLENASQMYQENAKGKRLKRIFEAVGINTYFDYFLDKTGDTGYYYDEYDKCLYCGSWDSNNILDLSIIPMRSEIADKYIDDFKTKGYTQFVWTTEGAKTTNGDVPETVSEEKKDINNTEVNEQNVTNNNQIVDDTQNESSQETPETAAPATNWGDYARVYYGSDNGKNYTLNISSGDTTSISGNLEIMDSSSGQTANVPFSGTVTADGAMVCDYADDGVGNKGTLYINLENGAVRISNTERGYNMDAPFHWPLGHNVYLN